MCVILVLTRHLDERIIIRTPGGEQIVITINDVRGDRVKVGLDAPASVKIIRGELVEYEEARS